MRKRVAVIMALTLLGAGCAPPALPERMRAYRERVDAILGHESSARKPLSAILPRRRERVLPVGDHRIGVFEFLAIQRCGLGALAGERNSPLGQVMPPTRRLVYEHRVQGVGRACLPHLDAPRREELAMLLDAKRSELPQHRWNAVWGEGELERLLSFAGGRTAGAPVDAEDALGTLRRALEGMDGSAETAQAVADALGALRRVPPVGPLLRELATVAAELGAVSEAVAAVPPGPCRDERVALAHAFEGHYTPLQAALVQLDRQSQGVLGELAAIHEATARPLAPRSDPLALVAAESFSLDAEQGIWRRARAALRRHATAWEPILLTCGVLPDPDGPATRPAQGGGGRGASSSGGNVTETGIGR